MKITSQKRCSKWPPRASIHAPSLSRHCTGQLLHSQIVVRFHPTHEGSHVGDRWDLEFLFGGTPFAEERPKSDNVLDLNRDCSMANTLARCTRAHAGPRTGFCVGQYVSGHHPVAAQIDRRILSWCLEEGHFPEPILIRVHFRSFIDKHDSSFPEFWNSNGDHQLLREVWLLTNKSLAVLPSSWSKLVHKLCHFGSLCDFSLWSTFRLWTKFFSPCVVESVLTKFVLAVFADHGYFRLTVELSGVGNFDSWDPLEQYGVQLILKVQCAELSLAATHVYQVHLRRWSQDFRRERHFPPFFVFSAGPILQLSQLFRSDRSS